MGEIIHYILNLGSAIFLPLIMIIFGLLVKLPPRKAIISGLTLGIAFTGMNVVVGFMMNTISPVAQAFVTNTGIQFSTIDVGWSPMASIAWAWPYGLLMFPLQLGINILFLILGWTDTLNVDLWNVWGKIFTATMVSYISGNVALGFVAASIQVVLELLVGSATQKEIYALTGIPGITCTHYMMLQTIWMNPVCKLLDKIPALNKVSLDADAMKDKLGIFSENSVMGFIIGFLLAIFAKYDISASLNIAMSVATALVLFPMVANLFMKALAPIADAASTFTKNKFKGREICIGLDWPFLGGRSEIWVVSIILVPIELGLAIWLSKLGVNNVLPLAGIVNIVVAVPALIAAKGNMVKMLILSILFTPAYLMVATAFAPACTALGQSVSTIEIQQGQMITYYDVEAPMFRYFISYAMAGTMNGIIGMAVFAGLLYWFIKEMKHRDESQDWK